MRHWRPSEKVNWQRSGNWFVSMGFSMKKGNGGMAFVSGSCRVVICNVIGGVNAGQWLTMWITRGPVENVVRRQSRSYRECRLSELALQRPRLALSFRQVYTFCPVAR